MSQTKGSCIDQTCILLCVCPVESYIAVMKATFGNLVQLFLGKRDHLQHSKEGLSTVRLCIDKGLL